MTRRRGALGACAALTLLVMGGCALPADKLPPAPRAAVVTTGGVLSVGITAPGGVDPLSFHDQSGTLVGSVLCDTLVTVDPETGIVKPGLAKKWTVTDDGARIIFQLRKGTRFHDGREVRSADIVDSFRRLANPEYASRMADLMDSVLGVGQFRRAVDEGLPSPSLPGVRVIEPYSFEILLARKHPEFLRALAHPAMAPVSKSPYDRGDPDAAANPQCAGPYQLTAPYRPGAGEIVLKRFPGYHRASAAFTAGGAGYTEQIRFVIFPDEPAVVGGWERGEVDVAPVPSSANPSLRAKYGAKAVVGDSAAGEFIAMPYGETSPFSNRRVRRALSLALDRDALVADAFGGAHKPATGFLPPALTSPLVRGTGKTTAKAVEFGCPEMRRRDADQARRLWAEAREAGDEAQRAVLDQPMKLSFNDESSHRKLAEAVARQWREVLGIDVQPAPLSWADFEGKTAGGAALSALGSLPAGAPLPGSVKGAGAGAFDGLFRLSYAPRFASAEAFLGPLFHSSEDPHTNVGRYSSSAFDAALDEDTRPVVNDAERQFALHKAEDLLCSDVPAIPVAFAQRTHLVQDRVVSALASGSVVTRLGDLNLRELALR